MKLKKFYLLNKLTYIYFCFSTTTIYIYHYLHNKSKKDYDKPIKKKKKFKLKIEIFYERDRESLLIRHKKGLWKIPFLVSRTSRRTIPPKILCSSHLYFGLYSPLIYFLFWFYSNIKLLIHSISYRFYLDWKNKEIKKS